MSTAFHSLFILALDANSIVPILFCVFFALNLSIDSKYAGLRGTVHSLISQSPKLIALELCGFGVVISIIAAGLLVCPTGLLANDSELEKVEAKDEHLFNTRHVWPMLLHPDSLLVCGELFLALSVALLCAQGACCQGKKVLSLALMLMTVARIVRVAIWCRVPDYTPEGPLGGRFAASSACLSLLMFLPATFHSLRTSMTSLKSGARELLLLLFVLNVCACLVEENHMVASDSAVGNFAFSIIDTLDSFAAPLLAWQLCANATQMPRLNGALVAVLLAHVLSLVWLLDFTGFLEETNSTDPYTKTSIEMKAQFMTLVHGHPYFIFGVGSIVRVASASLACIGYNVLRFSALDVSCKEMLLVEGSSELDNFDPAIC